MTCNGDVLLAFFAIHSVVFAQCQIGPGRNPFQPLELRVNITAQTGTGGNSFTMSGSCPGEPSAHVRFKLDTARTPYTGFVVSPSEGTTPVGGQVGINPERAADLRPGTTGAALYFTTVDQNPAFTTDVSVRITAVASQDPPVVESVLNAASLVPRITPGAVVLIRGSDLGPNITYTLGLAGMYPTTLGNTTVTINGIPAPLLSCSPTAIKAAVPYGVAGAATAQVVVTRYPQSSLEKVSAAFDVPVAAHSLGISNRTQSRGSPDDIQNCDASRCTPNSVDNPAPPGSIIVRFATGVAPGSGPGWTERFRSYLACISPQPVFRR